MSINTNAMAKLAINKSILKEYTTDSCERTVYLNDGNEFQINLFNPHTFVVGCCISINDEIMPGYIILRPGERVWLERYLNCAKKLKFSTYEVDDHDQAVEKAIAKNGIIKITFYKEDNTPTLSFDNAIWYRDQNYYDDDFVAINNTTLYNIKSREFNDGASSYNTASSGCNYNVDLKGVTTAYTTNDAINSVDTILQNTATSNSTKSKHITQRNATLSVPARSSSVKETGRISEGSYSKQGFNTVNVKLSTFSFCTEIIQILPMSRKPYTVKDLQKRYCTNCGRKIKENFKYCPYCGGKIDE